MSVKRYESENDGYMADDVDGSYVSSADYDTLDRSMRESWASEKRLAARIAELEAALRWAVKELTTADAFTDDEVSRPPSDIEVPIIGLMTAANRKGEPQ